MIPEIKAKCTSCKSTVKITQEILFEQCQCKKIFVEHCRWRRDKVLIGFEKKEDFEIID